MSAATPGGVRHLSVVSGNECGGGGTEAAARTARSRREIDWAILMARAQDGDGAAYARLLRETTPYLRSLAARWHRNPADIEDAVQDVLLTIHAVRQTYDPTRPFAPWLVAIARRRFIDRVRGQSRRAAQETPLTADHERHAEPCAMVGDEIGLDAVIGRLPPKQQKAISLLKLQELPLKEASRRSGMSVASLKVATHRALKSLRRMLTEGHEP